MSETDATSTPADLGAALRDDAEIRGVVLSTARAFPLRDPKAYAAAFCDDGVVVEPGRRGSLAPVVHMERPVSAPWVGGQQILTNLAVATDGDVATVSSCFIDAVAHDAERSASSAAVLTGGRFRDRLERRDGAWRIAERTISVDWTVEGDASALGLFLTSAVTTADVADRLRVLDSRPGPRDAQELLDRQAVTDAIMRCARGIDRLDEEIFDRYFRPEMTMVVAGNEIPAPAFVQGSRRDAPNRLATQHALSNAFVAVDGDRAVADTLLLGVIAFRDGFGPAFIDTESAGLGGLMLSGCRYVDDWVRGPDGWLLERRVLVQEWMGRFDDSGMLDLLGRPDANGRRDPEDPSYARLFAPTSPADLQELTDRRRIDEAIAEGCTTADGYRYLLTTQVTVDGDAAAAEVYCLTVTGGDGPAKSLAGSRELIDLARAGSGWRITRTTTIPEWLTVATTAAQA